MVIKKRVDSGSNGFLVPRVPKAPRSTRRRDTFKKKVEDHQICPFELLAAVAGQLLQETESSSASSNDTDLKDHCFTLKDVMKQERLDSDGPFKTECLAQLSCEESSFAHEHASEKHNKKHVLQHIVVEKTSLVSNSDCSDDVETALKLTIPKVKDACTEFPNKVEVASPRVGESCNVIIGSETQIQVDNEGEGRGAERLTMSNNNCSLMDPAGLHGSLVEMSCKGQTPNSSFVSNMNVVKVDGRDDDENSFRSNPRITKAKANRSISHMGNRRVRKLLTYKYWKVAPKLRDYDFPEIDDGPKPVSRSRKTYYGRDRRYCDTLIKKRRVVDQSSAVTSDGGLSVGSFSNSHVNVKTEKRGSGVLLHKANPVSSIKDYHSSFRSTDSHVRLSIKSFRVPELFIEVPETATVGSLKRRVLDAVSSILGSELHVGVLLRGKKVKDDNRTLLQSGICHNNTVNTLGFTLEPSVAQATSMCPEVIPSLLPCTTNQHLDDFPATPVMDSGIPDASSDASPLTSLDNHAESDGLTPSYTDNLTDDSKALIPMPAMDVEALAMVPMNSKTRRAELAQRRIRRPFSVAEVEALVQAVEELGTGRWRDVKLRSFDSANHRTYVDLKDKWKTLVHTAQISPQQRRGQPVPQELLDRVLAAHAYWSQHQAKQHNRHQITPKLIEASAD